MQDNHQRKGAKKTIEFVSMLISPSDPYPPSIPPTVSAKFFLMLFFLTYNWGC